MKIFRKQKKPLTRSDFGISAGYVEHIKKSDAKIFTQYMLNSTYDALSLKFYQMLDRNVQLNHCKNCDHYFVIKSKHNSDYCDRVANGGTQTCQQIAAVKKFAEKNKRNDAYKVFNKYYKRYHERKNVGTIKRDVFDKWNRQACTMRDECIDTKGDAVAFEEWCYESFSNRPRKEKVVLKAPAFTVGIVVVFECNNDTNRGVVKAINNNAGSDSSDEISYDIYVDYEGSTYTEVFESDIIKNIDPYK